MGGPDVVSVGNANIDIIVYVKSAPGPDEAVEASHALISPGGAAANFAAATSRLGLRAGFIGCVGRDSFGAMFIEDLKSYGVDVSRVVMSDKPTGIVMVVVEEGGVRRMIAWRGANLDLEPRHLDMEYVKAAKVVHVASIRLEVALAVLKEASKGSTLTSYDPGSSVTAKGLQALEEALRHVDILYLNARELEHLTGSADSASARLLLDCGPRVVVVKRGAGGIFVAAEGEELSMPALSLGKVVDTTGAGDAFAAGFTVGLLKGGDLRSSATLGLLVAGIKVTRRGARTGLPSVEEVVRVAEDMGLSDVVKLLL